MSARKTIDKWKGKLMKSHTTKIRVLAASGAVIALALAAGPSGAAKSRIPELGDADPPAVQPALQPAPRQQASFRLTQLSNGPCGSETYAFTISGHRRVVLC